MAKTSINSGCQDAQTLNQKDIAVLDSEEPQLHLGVFLLGNCEDFHVFSVLSINLRGSLANLVFPAGIFGASLLPSHLLRIYIAT